MRDFKFYGQAAKNAARLTDEQVAAFIESAIDAHNDAELTVAILNNAMADWDFVCEILDL